MRTSLIARILSILSVLFFGSLAMAGFEAAMDAYERQDYATAAREFRALAREGGAEAQYMLGRMYERGRGVTQDFVQAHGWYNLAASQGHRHAAQARDALAERMTPNQVAEAQRLAREWQSGTRPGIEEQPAEPSRKTVAAIQRFLNDLGYDAGSADGLMGSKTRSAIRSYQADQGLSVTGQPSQELLQHLQRTHQASAREKKRPGEREPWQQVLLQDAFNDGNYTANPAWRAISGEFWVEGGVGLRSVHELRQRAAEVPQEPSPRDLAGAIVGAIIEEAIRPRDQEARPRTEPVSYAEIHVPRQITNAFAIRSTLSAYKAQGQLIFGPYQSQDRADGYRLAFSPGQTPRFALLRVSRSGSSVIESSDRDLGLNLGQQYTVRWTRDTRGEMAVFVEEQELFRVIDRSFRDPFNGFTLINQGGDYALRAIAIYGTE